MAGEQNPERASGHHRAILRSAVAALAVWSVQPAAWHAEAQAPTAGQPAEKVYKNIQAFRGLPSTQLLENMFFMAGSLGVGCKECHVNFTDFEKDDNPKKQTARNMIAMVRRLNQENFDGQITITCNTCHRGRAVPLAPLAFAAIKSRAASRASVPAASGPLPSVDQIFERYVAQTEGKPPAGGTATDVLIGSMFSSEGWTAPLRIYLRSPDKFLAVFDIGWFSYDAFNGNSGWSQDDQGVHQVTGRDLALLKQKSALFHPSLLQGHFSALSLRGKDMIEEREAYFVEGVLPGAGSEKLYFDAENGLLVRIEWGTETSLGRLPHQISLRDYREAGGAMLPFEVDDFAPDFSSIYKITEANHGAPVPEQLFEKPSQPWKGFPN